MIPTDSYRIAEPKDYKECHKAAGGPEWQFTFPTVVARRNGKLLGFLATTPNRGYLVAGRIWVDPELKAPGIITFRMAQAYEECVKKMGLHYYIIPVLKNSPLEPLIRKFLDTEPYAEDAEHQFYQRWVVKKEAA